MEEDEQMYVLIIFQAIATDLSGLLREVLRPLFHKTQLTDFIKARRIRLPPRCFTTDTSDLRSLDDLDITSLVDLLKLIPELRHLYLDFDKLRRLRNEICHLPNTKISEGQFNQWFGECCRIANVIEDHLKKPRTVSEKLINFRNSQLSFRGTTCDQTCHNEVDLNIRSIETKLYNLQQKGSQVSNLDLETLEIVKWDVRFLKESLLRAFSRLKGLESSINRIGRTLQPEDTRYSDDQTFDLQEASLPTSKTPEHNRDLNETVLYNRDQVPGNVKRNLQSRGRRHLKNETWTRTPDSDVMYFSGDVNLRSQRPQEQQKPCSFGIDTSAGSSSVVPIDDNDNSDISEFKKQVGNVTDTTSTNNFPEVREGPMKQMTTKITTSPIPEPCKNLRLTSTRKDRKRKYLLPRRSTSIDSKQVFPVAFAIKRPSPLNKKTWANSLLLRRSISDGMSTNNIYRDESQACRYRFRINKIHFKRRRKKCTCYEALGIDMRTPITPTNCICNGDFNEEPGSDVVILHSSAPEDEEIALKFLNILVNIKPKLKIETQSTILLPGRCIFDVRPLHKFRQILVLITPYYYTEYAYILRRQIKTLVYMNCWSIIPVYMENVKRLPVEFISAYNDIKFYKTLNFCQPNNLEISPTIIKSIKKSLNENFIRTAPPNSIYF